MSDSRSWLRSEKPGMDGDEPPLYVQVRHLGPSKRKDELFLPPSGQISALSGPVQVMVTMPSGQTISDVVHLREGEVLRVRTSQLRDETRLARARTRKRARPDSDEALESLGPADHRSVRLISPAWPGDADDGRSAVIRSDVRLEAGGGSSLSVSGDVPNHPSKWSALRVAVGTPRKWVVSVPCPWPDLFSGTRPVRLSLDEQSPRVDPPGHAAATLLYLASGHGHVATSARKDLLAVAEAHFQEKYQNPFAAVCAAFVLLQVDESEVPVEWFENLAGDFIGIADGAIALGQLRLREDLRDERRMNEARGWFVEAIRRGPPIFTEGLRLLVHGLDHIVRLRPHDIVVSNCLDRARSLAAVTDWDAGFAHVRRV